jgi:hypothetical protein
VPEALLPRVLLVFGLGFLVANVTLGLRILRNRRLRPSAVLTWPVPHPPFHSVEVTLSVILFILVFVKLIVLRQLPTTAFGEIMMLVYYGYMRPRRLQLAYGFFRRGVWMHDGFLAYRDIGEIKWHEDDQVTLLLVPKSQQAARRLVVPQEYFGAVRRILRDRIAAGEITLDGKTLDLGMEDQRYDV